jgi:ribosomal-protein-alanine N-acetyltransferase
VSDDVWPARLRTADSVDRVLRETIAHWERWGFGPWTIVERGSGRVVGRVGLARTMVLGCPEVEAEWFLSGDVWGRGYATEMAGEAVRVAFEVLKLDEVVALTVPANVASQAVVRKLGFHHEGEIEHAGIPHVLFRLTARRWVNVTG